MDGRLSGQSTATQLAALVEAARLLSSSLTLDDVLEALQARAGALLGADGAAIHLAAPDGRNFVRRRLSGSANGGKAPIEAGDLLAPDGFIAEAVATGRVGFAPDFRHDPRAADDAGRAIPDVVSSLVAPLVADGETLGILLMHWSRRVEVDDGQIAVVEALASQAGVAIRNARLHEAAVEAARLEGTVKTARAVAHSVNNHLTRVIAAAELLQLELDGELRHAGLLSSIVEAGEEAARFVARLQQALRFVEQPTPIDPALHLERSVDIEARG
ncbi:MAG TPA: GAF domain-containing protein [Chloroflexota bacterium]|jgi:GAF domain-containing protein